jgi:hypothetical protein
VAGVVTIVGQVDLPEFDRYVVEYGESADPIGWGFVAEGRERHPEPAPLAQWNTAGLVNTAHTLRIIAYDRRGSAHFSAPVHVMVQNATPEASPSPSVTATSSPTVTFVFTATATPAPGTTPTVILPSPTSALPTPTVTPGDTPTPQATTPPDEPSPTPPPPPTATPDQGQGLLADIEQPVGGSQVQGQVQIIGTAAGSQFARYVLEFGVGNNPADWLLIAEDVAPVQRNVLGLWDTDNLSDGRYTVRLTVFAQDDSSVTVIRRYRVED